MDSDEMIARWSQEPRLLRPRLRYDPVRSGYTQPGGAATSVRPAPLDTPGAALASLPPRAAPSFVRLTSKRTPLARGYGQPELSQGASF